MCNVIATINEFDDAQMNLPFTKTGKGKKGCTRRVFTVEFDDPDDETPVLPAVTEEGVIKIDDIGSIANGASVSRAARVSVSVCDGGLGFGGAGFAGSDRVNVTRVDDDTWTVATQSAPADKGLCAENGVLYHVPFAITIVRQ